MSNFALDVNSAPGDVISSLNYALANLGNNTGGTQANVLTANVQTGIVSTTYSNSGGYAQTTVISYLYQYLNVRYANNATGSSGFSNVQTNHSYFGLQNTTSNSSASSNPVDYQWYAVTGGFGTTKQLWYNSYGGRQIAFSAANSAPGVNFVTTVSNVAIDLDTVTGAVANQIVNVNAYYQANTTPATPSGGFYNFANLTLTPPAGWSSTIPTFVANTNIYVSSDVFQGNTTANVGPSRPWTTPAVYSSQFQGNTGPAGQRGFVPMGFVLTATDWATYGNVDFTNAFQTSRTNPSPPIGLGFAPIQYDTAQFAYQNLFTGNTNTIVKQYDGTGWTTVVGQVVSGGLIVPGTITANVLNVNEVYTLTLKGGNVTPGVNSGIGFWLTANAGAAYFGGNTAIGNSLSVGNNAQIGANLNVGNNLSVGTNANIGNNLTVADSAVIGNNLSVGTNASIGNNLAVGTNANIGAGLNVSTNATIGNNLTVGTNAQVGANLNVGASAVIGTNLTIGNNAVIGGYASIGSNVSVGTNLTVGTNATIGGVIIGGVIGANQVGNTQIGTNSIDGGKISTGTIGSTQIGSNAIITGKIATNSITANTIAANAITVGAIAAGAVTANTIAANAITAGTIAANAITSYSLSANSVVAGTVAANAITSYSLAANSVTAVALAANSITGNAIAANTITTTNLVFNSATGSVSEGPTYAGTYPVAFYNLPGQGAINSGNYLWPYNTRGFAQDHGLSYVPQLTGNTQTNTRISIVYSGYIFSANTATLVELWKSGSSVYYLDTYYSIKCLPIERTYTALSTDVFYAGGSNGSIAINYNNGASGSWTTQQIANNPASGFNNGMPIETVAGQYVSSGATLYPEVYYTTTSGRFFATLANTGVPTYYGTVSNTGVQFGSVSSIGSGFVKGLDTFIFAGQNGIIYHIYGGFGTTTTVVETTGVFSTFYGIDLQQGPTNTNGTNVVAVAVGSNGSILRNVYTNGGSTLTYTGWVQKTSGVITNLNAVRCNWATLSGTGSQWCVVGDGGVILTSSDGNTWTQQTSPTTQNLYGLTYGNGYWCAVGANSVIIYSTDGITWTATQGPQGSDSTYRQLNCVAFGQLSNSFVAAGQSIIMRATTTPATWTTQYDGGVSVTSTLTRLTAVGSDGANVANVTIPPVNQQLGSQVVSGQYVDYAFTANVAVTYYLVMGNLSGNAVSTNSATLQVTEFKR